MKDTWKKIITGMSVLFVAALVCGGLQAWWSGTDLASALSVSPVESAAQEAGFPLIEVPEMREIVDSGSHLVLDARSMVEYDQGHIPGAMPLPLSGFETAFPGIAPLISSSDPLVVYCSGPRCDDALLLAQRLRDAGFSDVSLFIDGWQGWTQ